MACVGVCISRCLKEEMVKATDKQLHVISNLKNNYSTKELKGTKE